MAEKLYKDMGPYEYLNKMYEAGKLFNDYRKKLPYSDGTSKRKDSEIKKKYIINNLNEKEILHKAEEEKDRRSVRLSEMGSRPGIYINTVQLVITLINILMGAFYLNIWLQTIEKETLKNEKEFLKLKRKYDEAEDKKEWLEEHPEYPDMEKKYKKQTITKKVKKEVEKVYRQ